MTPTEKLLAEQEKVVAERDQLSHGRLIHVVSVFPALHGTLHY